MNKELINYEKVLKRQIRQLSLMKLELSQLIEHRILITGGAGSIGSYIVKALDKIVGVKYLATDRDESALHSLSLELNSTALFHDHNFMLLDIRDLKGSHDVIKNYRPTIIIHAAALKHLSVLERQPREAMLTNVYGTLNMLKIAQELGVQKFINISTDKASQATSVLGRSKYIAELLTSQFREEINLDFKSVRFGNVFGSRGSVIETFVSQIRNKKPITLTDPEITRFFMHPIEAALLTIKSIFLDKGHVHVFNMGQPIKIVDLVNNLQNLLQSDLEIVYVGLRDGEKISETLLGDLNNLHESVPGFILSGSHDLALGKNLEITMKTREKNSDFIDNYLRGRS